MHRSVLVGHKNKNISEAGIEINTSDCILCKCPLCSLSFFRARARSHALGFVHKHSDTTCKIHQSARTHEH
jgi:hypothetical protein